MFAMHLPSACVRISVLYSIVLCEFYRKDLVTEEEVNFEQTDCNSIVLEGW